MRLRIATPARQIVDAEVREVVLPGSEGEFGVLPLHVTFLGGLAPGVLTYVQDGTAKRVVVAGGFAEVRDDNLVILADGAEFPDEIDPAQARSEVSKVEEALAAAGEDPAETERLLRDLALARARVSASS